MKNSETNTFTTTVILSIFSIGFFACKKASQFLHRYSDTIEDILQHIIENALAYNIPDTERIINALVYNKDHFSFTIDTLNKNKLNKLADSINATFIHYSGNCALLAKCMLYNLKLGKNVLAVKNTYPFYQGIGENLIDLILFGQLISRYPINKFSIQASDFLSSIDEVQKMLINIFEGNGERCFIIGILPNNIKTSFINPGHFLNAVIIGDKPEIVFVDAWKTSDYLPSVEQLIQRYPKSVFDIQYYKGPIATEVQRPMQLENMKNFK